MKLGRGGKRKGAGRKPLPNKKIKKTITLRPDHVAWLKGKNTSREIEIALDKYIEQQSGINPPIK